MSLSLCIPTFGGLIKILRQLFTHGRKKAKATFKLTLPYIFVYFVVIRYQVCLKAVLATPILVQGAERKIKFA